MGASSRRGMARSSSEGHDLAFPFGRSGDGSWLMVLNGVLTLTWLN